MSGLYQKWQAIDYAGTLYSGHSCDWLEALLETSQVSAHCFLRYNGSNRIWKGHTMNLIERITIEPGKCGGRPCIRGLRIRVKDVLGLLVAGASHQEILEDYPDLEEADILAALTYAAEQSDHLILHAA